MTDERPGSLQRGAASTPAGWRRAWPREPLVSWLPALGTRWRRRPTREGAPVRENLPPQLCRVPSLESNRFSACCLYPCWPSEIPEGALLALSSESSRAPGAVRRFKEPRVFTRPPCIVRFSFTLRTVSLSQLCAAKWHAGVARPSVARASRPSQMLFLPVVGWKKKKLLL